ncbi:hypothetical protein OEZ86_003113 [Tetradesmus obliquus]|nr:hypothetical protein OEZ86_003113 [Tetradesmus obliquus]
MLASQTRTAFGTARPTRSAPSLARCGLKVQCVAQPSRASVSKKQDNAVNPALFAGALAAPFLFEALPALATGGEFGILEGRTAALIHPAVMGGLFVASVYAGWLGWQYRRSRTLVDDIKALKAQLPKPAAEGEPAPASPLTAQIAELEKERKELIQGGFRDKHNAMGSILLGGGVTIGVAGCINTWMRTGKLFPGPHLFAGAGIVVLWALAAALVPNMQKGDNNARNMHIALNAVNVALFAWQIPTGLEIVGKVFQFTQWP